MKDRGKREISEKTRRPTASSSTVPTCKNPEAVIMLVKLGVGYGFGYVVPGSIIFVGVASPDEHDASANPVHTSVIDHKLFTRCRQQSLYVHVIAVASSDDPVFRSDGRSTHVPLRIVFDTYLLRRLGSTPVDHHHKGSFHRVTGSKPSTSVAAQHPWTFHGIWGYVCIHQCHIQAATRVGTVVAASLTTSIGCSKLFCLDADDRRIRVWRRPGHRCDPRFTSRPRGVMVWGAISYNSSTPLVLIEGALMARRYVQVHHDRHCILKEYYRVRWRSGNSMNSHSGEPRFDSRSGHPVFGSPWFSEITPSHGRFLPQFLLPVQLVPSLMTSLRCLAVRRGVPEFCNCGSAHGDGTRMRNKIPINFLGERFSTMVKMLSIFVYLLATRTSRPVVLSAVVISADLEQKANKPTTCKEFTHGNAGKRGQNDVSFRHLSVLDQPIQQQNVRTCLEAGLSLCRPKRCRQISGWGKWEMASGIIHHNFHMQKSWSELTGDRAWFAVVGGECASHCANAAPKKESRMATPVYKGLLNATELFDSSIWTKFSSIICLAWNVECPIMSAAP
ncbi:hypothetical protein PR048_006529 [Dryococelus australis]|uniref:Uncharacterized protein n=1 Tax=Dryococelus australis TaxID=614101 RepID=A0ABQ9IB81_9NEOP|nr:hypothetical protein PR048_006529 [Dryococelus australis]